MFVGWQFIEDAKLLRREELDGGGLDLRCVVLQEPVEPLEGVNVKLLRIEVRAFGDLQSQVLARSVEPVDAAHLFMNADDSLQRKDRVFVGV